MKSFLTPLFLIVFVSFFKLAAQNWLPAYVIVNRNDTLYGLVDFKVPKSNQERCFFKKDEHSPVITYFPKDILGYRFTPEGKYFVSKEIEIDGVSKKVFVEFMVEGMLNLYYYIADTGREHYFFEKETGELFSITKETDKLEGRFVKSDTKYDGMIRYKFKDYAPITRNPKRFKFNQASMIHVAKTYHDLVCTTGEDCIVFENQKPDATGFNVRFSAYTAVDRYVFRFFYKETTTRECFIPAFGAEIELVYPQLSKKISVYADVSISKLDHTFNYIKYGEAEYFDGIYSYYYKKHFDVYPLTARFGVKYAYPMNTFTPMIKLGISNKHLFGEVASYDFRVIGNSDINDIPTFYSNVFMKNYPGIHSALGSEFNLKNGGAVSLCFTFDAYRQRRLAFDPPILSKYLITYGVKLGYVF